MTTNLGPVDIKLTASGISDVLNSFKSVESRLAAFERKMSEYSKSGARERIKANEDEAKQKERVGKKAQSDEEKRLKESEKANEAWARQLERIKLNSATMAGRLAKKQADDEIREAERSAKSRERLFRQVAGKGVGALSGTFGTISRIAGAGLALGGGLSLSSAYSHEMNMQRSAAALSVASRVPGQIPISTGEAIARARTISKDLNMDENEVLEGMHSIVAKTGRGKLAMDLSGDVAKVAKAEGVNMQELANSVGIAAAQNPNLSNKELVQMMKILVAQGKEGSVEIADMAKVLPTAIAKATSFEGNQGDNQAKLATLLQIGIKTTASPEEAATAIKNISTEITRHQKEFAKSGIDVHGEGGKIKDVNVLLAESIAKTKGSPFKLEHLFGERAGAIVNALTPVYEKAEKDKKGSGQQAVLQYLNDFNKRRLTDAQLDEDLNTVRATDAEKASKAFNDLEREVGVKLVPKLTELVPKLTELLPAFSKLLDNLIKLIDWAEKHPWEAAFAALGTKVTTAIVGEILKAKISEAIGKAFGGGGGGGVPGTGGGGVTPGPGGGGGLLTTTATVGGGLAAAFDAEHLYEAGKAAKDTHDQGGGAAKSAHAYIEEWQSGNAGWIGGAKWNPLVQLANIGTGYAAMQGTEVKATKPDDQLQADAERLAAARKKAKELGITVAEALGEGFKDGMVSAPHFKRGGAPADAGPRQANGNNFSGK